MKIIDTLELIFASAGDATIFHDSFSVELAGIPMKRSTVEISHYSPEDPRIVFTIKADDIIGYRATMNTIIQSAHVVERTLNLVDDISKDSSPPDLV